VRQEVGKITSKKVDIRPLAAPDCLEFTLPAQHICLISDDGSSLTSGFATSLRKKGWPIVVIRYDQRGKETAVVGESIGVLNEEIPVITMNSDDEVQVQRQLDDIITRFGPVGGYIHFHPELSKSSYASPVHFDVTSESILRQVFFIAKFLQPYLTAAAQLPNSGTRAFFITVTRLDGGFGTLGRRDIDVVAGGLAGLTKSLALEWSEVFCRIIDLSPDIKGDVIQLLMDELYDPNQRLREVAWSNEGRVTLGTV
jgi:hypothetical protein